ncbi:MAG: hypothetical protein GX790_09890 [Syntrophomonadaceae bacterium]|nr:hypothetical protein [Syntrophomonadaceae bacterium]
MGLKSGEGKIPSNFIYLKFNYWEGERKGRTKDSEFCKGSIGGKISKIIADYFR